MYIEQNKLLKLTNINPLKTFYALTSLHRIGVSNYNFITFTTKRYTDFKNITNCVPSIEYLAANNNTENYYIVYLKLAWNSFFFNF